MYYVVPEKIVLQKCQGGPVRCKTVTNVVPRGAPPVQNRNKRSAKASYGAKM